MKTEDVLEQELKARMARMEAMLRQAFDLLEKRDYLQCAVRIQEAGQQGQFDTALMNVFDAMTSDSAEARAPRAAPR